MARKKPPLSLRRPGDAVNPLKADDFVRGLSSVPAVAAPPTASAPTPRRPDAPAAGAAASKSLVYRKRTDDHRRRMTIYLSEDLSRRLRLYAAQQDLDYSDVLAEALEALLARKGAP